MPCPYPELEKHHVVHSQNTLGTLLSQEHCRVAILLKSTFAVLRSFLVDKVQSTLFDRQMSLWCCLRYHESRWRLASKGLMAPQGIGSFSELVTRSDPTSHIEPHSVPLRNRTREVFLQLVCKACTKRAQVPDSARISPSFCACLCLLY